MRRDRVELAAFLGVAIAVSWPIMLVAPSSPAAPLVGWVPGALALLLTRRRGVGVRRRLGVDRLGWPDAYLFAIWVPVLFVAGRIALTVALGNGRLDDDVGGLHPASGAYPDGAVVLRVIAAILVVPIVNAFVLLGSELGWRAYLVQRLLPLGSRPAVALASLAWCAWQLPLVLGRAGERWPVEAGTFLVWCVLVGEILGWLYLRTGSVWAPALFSGTLAATSFLPGLVLRDVAADAAMMLGPAALVAPAIVVIAIRLGAPADDEPRGRLVWRSA